MTKEHATENGAALRPAGTRTPWTYVGVSRSAWYRLLSADQVPAAVHLPGTRPFWRLADLDKWLASLKPGRLRARRKATEPEEPTADPTDS